MMNSEDNPRHVSILSKITCFVVGKFFDRTLSRFPRTVQVETTNACNAQCVICPHKTMTRSIQTMDDETYTRVIDQCAEYHCRSVHLHNFGEPMLDKNIIERIQYAKSRGLKSVKLFTNGSILPERLAYGLATSGLDEIKISFDGASKEEFERIRYPLKFESVVRNIHRLVDTRNSNETHLKILVTCSSTTKKSDTMILLEKKVDSFSFGKIHNWGDTDVVETLQKKIRKPCSRVWRTFTVLSDGTVSLCCLDYDGKVIVGDTKSDPIVTIWKNDPYKKLRKLHSAGCQHEISICDACTKSYI